VREPSWYNEDAFALLAAHDVTLCLHDVPGSATERWSLGPFVYVRFHGADGRYQGGYPAHALASWASFLADQGGA
jgi:uncharacterized protein YecE (DUF72 family)